MDIAKSSERSRLQRLKRSVDAVLLSLAIKPVRLEQGPPIARQITRFLDSFSLPNMMLVFLLLASFFNIVSAAAANTVIVNSNITNVDKRASPQLIASPDATTPSVQYGMNLMEAQLRYRDPFIIDTFEYNDRNDLGFWHGSGENLDVHYGVDRRRGGHYVRLYPKDPDQNFHSQVSAVHCTNFLPFRERYLHVVFSGSNKFSISLNQNNPECRPGRNPYPATWDTVEARRYLSGKNDIYVPMSHFAIDLSKIVSISFNGFYSGESVTLHRIEIVRVLPTGASVPLKLPNGQMILKCSRPNSFAFGIDDGQPRFAQEVMNILEEEKVLVTFFVVGQGLRDKETNFTQVYKEMLRRGHQIALHSNTHQKMEALDDDDIEDEILENIDAFKDHLEIQSRYFRPPYGTIGARTRQILAARLVDPYIVNWSVDVEDWLWADTDTPERQIEAFTRDIMKGGNLAVMHYLNPSTVAYFRQFIHTVKDAGMNIMRIDQCLEDPDAPPLK